MNCVLPLDSNAREPMSGSRMTIEEYSRCIWRLEKKGKAADRAHLRKIVRVYASLRIRLLCTAVSTDEQVLQLFVYGPYSTCNFLCGNCTSAKRTIVLSLLSVDLTIDRGRVKITTLNSRFICTLIILDRNQYRF